MTIVIKIVQLNWQFGENITMKKKSGFRSLSLFFGKITITSLGLFSCSSTDENAIFPKSGKRLISFQAVKSNAWPLPEH
jgi:hypothetical protein